MPGDPPELHPLFRQTSGILLKRISKMFVLDNDTLTLVLHGNAKIIRRIERVPPYDI